MNFTFVALAKNRDELWANIEKVLDLWFPAADWERTIMSITQVVTDFEEETPDITFEVVATVYKSGLKNSVVKIGRCANGT